MCEGDWAVFKIHIMTQYGRMKITNSRYQTKNLSAALSTTVERQSVVIYQNSNNGFATVFTSLQKVTTTCIHLTEGGCSTGVEL